MEIAHFNWSTAGLRMMRTSTEKREIHQEKNNLVMVKPWKKPTNFPMKSPSPRCFRGNQTHPRKAYVDSGKKAPKS